MVEIKGPAGFEFGISNLIIVVPLVIFAIIFGYIGYRINLSMKQKSLKKQEKEKKKQQKATATSSPPSSPSAKKRS